MAGRWAVQFYPGSILSATGGTGHLVIADVLRPCGPAGGSRPGAAGPRSLGDGALEV
jgi:hypothetical protein